MEKERTVVALGKNMGIGWNKERIANQRFHLSDDSRVTVLATGMLYKAGQIDRIIFSTGKTAGKQVPSESEAMKIQLLRIFKSIPESVVVLEENSLNTYTNALEVKKVLEHQNIQNYSLLSVGFHLNRARYLFDRFGPKQASSYNIASEEVLRSKFPRFVENYIESSHYKDEVKREKRSLIIQKFPFGPKFLSLVANVKRNPNK